MCVWGGGGGGCMFVGVCVWADAEKWHGCLRKSAHLGGACFHVYININSSMCLIPYSN